MHNGYWNTKVWWTQKIRLRRKCRLRNPAVGAWGMWLSANIHAGDPRLESWDTHTPKPVLTDNFCFISFPVLIGISSAHWGKIQSHEMSRSQVWHTHRWFQHTRHTGANYWAAQRVTERPCGENKTIKQNYICILRMQIFEEQEAESAGGGEPYFK